jgi:hypothetical protein
MSKDKEDFSSSNKDNVGQPKTPPKERCPEKDVHVDNSETSAANVENGGGDEEEHGYETRLSALRIPQDFGAGFDTTGQIMMVRAIKPSKSRFFRTWMDPDMWEKFWMLTLDGSFEGRETFVVASNVVPSLREIAPSLMAIKMIVPYIYFEGEVSVWPIRMPKSDGQLDSWNQSAMKIAHEARVDWIRLGSNQDIGQYTAYPARASEDRTPDWRGSTPESVYDQAFKDCSIHSMDDPVVKFLRGGE